MDDELEPKKRSIDVESEIGMSRRDLLRRSAIVGGALLWAAPTIQTVGMKAAAAYGPSPGECSACYCYTPDGSGNIVKNYGQPDAFVDPGQNTADDCENWCKWQSGYNSSNGAGHNPALPAYQRGPFTNFLYCSGTENCQVTIGRPGRPVNTSPPRANCP